MKLERNLAYWLLVLGSGLWIGATLLAPIARAEGWAVAEWIYRFFRPVCHQIPGRSFFCAGHPLAVCNRCLGLYVGFFTGLLLLPYLHRLRSWLVENPRWVLAFMVPMLVDVLVVLNRPWDRFATGFAAGFPVALLVWAAVADLWHRFLERRKESYEPG